MAHVVTRGRTVGSGLEDCAAWRHLDGGKLPAVEHGSSSPARTGRPTPCSDGGRTLDRSRRGPQTRAAAGGRGRRARGAADARGLLRRAGPPKGPDRQPVAAPPCRHPSANSCPASANATSPRPGQGNAGHRATPRHRGVDGREDHQGGRRGDADLVAVDAKLKKIKVELNIAVTLRGSG